MATLWDRFEYLLREAEQRFFAFEFEAALEKWESYYQITAINEYGQILREIQRLMKETDAVKINTPSKLLTAFRRVRRRFLERRIHLYTYNLFLNLFKKLYMAQFRDQVVEDGLFHGIFNYLQGNYEAAVGFLRNYLQHNFESIEGRIFLGYAYMETYEQHLEAIALLTENLFLAADQLYEDDLYLPQFKMLFGKLFSKTGRKNAAAWLLPFEAWFRNFLVFKENERFYKLMVQKEQNERIIRVKYTTAERYRHFVRCLFVAEYTRQFIKDQPRIVAEQETYMEQLDAALFARYRRKRKPLKI